MVKATSASDGITACCLPVYMATPVPAPAPAPAPIAAPLPPPARAPISAPAAAPPPIFSALLLVWLLPFTEYAVLVTVFPSTDVTRMERMPGACRRPLSLATEITPCTGSPARASAVPLTTTSLASEPSQHCTAHADPAPIRQLA